MGRRPGRKPAALLRALALATIFVAATAHAEERWQRFVDKSRFMQIAVRLAPRVDLFQAIWDADRTAEIYGGTARDYFWWIRRGLAKCGSAECVDAFVAKHERGLIDAREFLLGEADVDVLGTEAAATAEFDRAHFTRIDVADRRRFDAAERLHGDELRQGALPVEKLRLGRHGLVAAAEGYGGGIDDIYAARPRLVLSSTIRETDAFRERENHPVLLALRWVRQAAVGYAHRYGKGPVDDGPLAAAAHPDALEKATEVAAALAAHPEELAPFFDNPRFVHRLNRARARLFQGFTNAEAARHLYEIVGLDHALLPYADRLEPFFTVAFRMDWSAAAIAGHRAKLPEAKAALETLGSFFTRTGIPAGGELHLFHGTWNAATYRNIATHGILPSEQGLAGMGVYAVDPRFADYARKWRDSTGKGFALRLCVKAEATFVDLTSAEGKTLLEAFRKLRPSLGAPWTEGKEEDALANFLGVDVVKYPYDDVPAYVIKNGDAVLRAEPWSHAIRSLAELRDETRKSADPIGFLRSVVAEDASVLTHLDYLLAELPLEKRIDTHLDLAPADGFDHATTALETINRYRRKHRAALPTATWARYYAQIPVKKLLNAAPEERAMRAAGALADAWEFFPLASLLEEANWLDATYQGGCIERVLRERRGWMRKYLQPARTRATITEELMVFQRRPLLYVELLEFLERERPNLYDANGWASAWSLVDFNSRFVQMYKHVPVPSHAPLHSPARLRDVLQAAFRVAQKAPQVLDQLRVRIRDLDESRLWAAIDETLVDVSPWTVEHSLFLVRIAAALPASAKAWSVFPRQDFDVPAERRLVGTEASTVASRLVLEATQGRFGSLTETVRTLRNVAGAFEAGTGIFHDLCLQIVRRAEAEETVDTRWRKTLGRAKAIVKAFESTSCSAAMAQ